MHRGSRLIGRTGIMVNRETDKWDIRLIGRTGQTGQNAYSRGVRLSGFHFMEGILRQFRYIFVFLGGICLPIKKPMNVSFAPLETQLYSPVIIMCDLGKLMAPPQIHLAYLTLLKFHAKQGRKPYPRDQTDLEVNNNK